MARNSQNSRKPVRKSTNSGSFGGVMEMARERPVAAVAAAAGAAAAGVFLWSKRAQISDQIGEWTDTMGERASGLLETVGSDVSRSPASRSTRSRTTANSRRPRAGNGDLLNSSSIESTVA